MGANGNITDIIDALGNRTRLTYKTNGLLETRTTPKGNLAYPTIDNNYTSTFTYNTLGLLETDTGPDPDGSGPLSRPVQSSGFNPLGQLTSTTDATGVITIYVPDLLGRILSETLPDPDGTGPLGQLVTTFKYTTAGDIQSITDPLGGKRSFIYDAKRQKVSEVNADGTTKAFQYDAHGNGITVIDELGREDRTIFDTRNRPIASLAPFDVQTSDSALSATRFDATGRTIATTDANGNTTIFTYDPMGRLLTTTDAMGFSAGNLYDDYGNVVTTTDRRGEQAIFECDVLNRLTEVRRPIFATGTTTVTGYYSISTNDYDPNGNLTKQIEYDLTGLALASIPADPRTLAASKQ